MLCERDLTCMRDEALCCRTQQENGDNLFCVLCVVAYLEFSVKSWKVLMSEGDKCKLERIHQTLALRESDISRKWKM